jgi:hypothetical protein
MLHQWYGINREYRGRSRSRHITLWRPRHSYEAGVYEHCNEGKKKERNVSMAVKHCS